MRDRNGWGVAEASTCSGGQKRSFGYSSLGRLLNATNPESGMTSYTYYDDGSLWTKTDARPAQSVFSYDPLNRVTGKTYSDYANPYPTLGSLV